MDKKNNFDLAKFKVYVNTYDEQCSVDGYTDEIIIKDILYGMGICFDEQKYKEQSGFLKFCKWVRQVTRRDK